MNYSSINDKFYSEFTSYSLDDLNALLEFEFETDRLTKVRDVFVFTCVTGMRFGELLLIKKSNVTDENIILKEGKDHSKQAREIPLTIISKFILKSTITNFH